jgi:hypothetical protein
MYRNGATATFPSLVLIDLVGAKTIVWCALMQVQHGD